MMCPLFKSNPPKENISWLSDVPEEQIALDAVFHFFKGNDSDFIQLYERRMVDTHAQQDLIYEFCSEYLLDNEIYVANIIASQNVKEFQEEIILPLSEEIKRLLNEDNNKNTIA